MLSKPNPKAVLLLTLVVLALNAFKITRERALDSVWESCPTQAAVCDDACKDLMQDCLGQCQSNSCAASCVSENDAAVKVWKCALKRGRSPFGQPESINKPVTINWGNLKWKNHTGE